MLSFGCEHELIVAWCCGRLLRSRLETALLRGGAIVRGDEARKQPCREAVLLFVAMKLGNSFIARRRCRPQALRCSAQSGFAARKTATATEQAV
jgi:hypothetical protein